MSSLLVLLLVGCDESGNTPPEILVDINPVILGNRLVDPDATALNFNLQFTNRGEETLFIDSVRIRGDARCSFAFLGPDVEEVGQEGAMFMRGAYLPTETGDDRIALEVRSNAENTPLLTVPVCGVGVDDLENTVEITECEAPPEDQPDCPF